MRRVSVALWIAISIFILALCVVIARPLYDETEASEVFGETYFLEDEWSFVGEDGKEQAVSVPFRFPAGEDTVTLTHAMPEDYAGLALNLSIRNAAIRVFLGGKPLYEAGIGDLGSAPRMEKRGELDEGEDAGRERRGLEVDRTSIKEEAGDVIIDLPSSISEDGDLIRVEAYAVDETHPIEFHEAFISKRDVMIIAAMRDSLIPLLCGVLILIAVVVLVTLDIMRIISKKRARGTAIMAGLGICSIFYCIVGTGLLDILFGNEEFFNKLGLLCVLIMPLHIAVFYWKGFHIHYPRMTSVMVWAVLLLTILQLILEQVQIASLIKMGPLFLGMLIVLIVLTMGMLVQWRKTSKGYRVIWMDLAALVCLLSSLVIAFYGASSSMGGYLNIRACLMALFFIFITAQHIDIVLKEFKQNVEEDARKLEQQIEIAEEAKAEAILANEAKGKFLANMSHEIRTPINAVLGMDEMILRESKESAIRGYAMDIFTAGQTLLSLINDILDFSKIESGKMEIVPVDYDISSLINDLHNMISTRAKAKDLIFEISVDEQLPARYFGDDVRIRQVLVNILTNAVKYTPQGNVWMRISGKREGENEILHFEVEDTGIGIKEEDLPKLYKAYERIEENRNRNIEGTGLGMNITLQLLALMGSRLQVESVYGNGSKFYFDITQKITDETPIGDFESRIKNASEQYTYAQSFTAPDAEILVVDDNSMNRKVFVSLLKATKIKITEAASGQESIDLAKKQHFDIIFMDHMMPEMDGVEAMKRIRALPDNPCADTPIYVLTANAVTGAREHYLEVGFDGFVSKPVVSEKLEKVIRDALPEDMLKPGEDNTDEFSLDDEKKTLPEDLPVIDGLDWNYGFLHLPDMELLKETLKEFYTLLPLHAEKLLEKYQKLPEEEAFDAYRIQVHGMKSSAATVGIVPLAGMAKILEYAARDGDLSIIQHLHDTFLREWLSYREKLTGVFGIGEESDSLPPADPVQTKGRLELLRVAMEEMEFDDADELMAALLEYSYEDTVKQKMQALSAAVTDLDSDAAEELIAEMMGM